MIEVVIQSRDPVTDTCTIQHVEVLPYADPPVKHKRLKRLAASVTAWVDAKELSALEAFSPADLELHLAWLEFLRGSEEQPEPAAAGGSSAATRRGSPALAAGPNHLLPWRNAEGGARRLLRPWRLGGITPGRTFGEVMLRRNGSAIDLWVRVDGSARWLALSAREVKAFLASAEREAVLEVESGGFPAEEGA